MPSGGEVCGQVLGSGPGNGIPKLIVTAAATAAGLLIKILAAKGGKSRLNGQPGEAIMKIFFGMWPKNPLMGDRFRASILAAGWTSTTWAHQDSTTSRCNHMPCVEILVGEPGSVIEVAVVKFNLLNFVGRLS